MPTIKVNGKAFEAPAGKNLLQACLDSGAFVPHYCYHPGLSPEGNCRMCIVKINKSRKLEPICMWRVEEGIEVTTEGPEVAEARKSVLEFLLINHPVDCPICDKAGECDLQDFTYDYRGGLSRFAFEDKNIRPTKDLGPNIRIWGNRCIVCSRCVRFCDEIPGTGEFTIVNRGDRAVIDTFPGIPIDNPMSLNVVDICPVGALIDKNFLFTARVWYAKETKSTCPSCSRGCSIGVTALDNEIKRIVPRLNPAVNGHWMCDEGRANVDSVGSPRRILEGRGRFAQVRDALKDGGSWAIVVSTTSTLEEMYLVRRLAEGLVAPVGVLTHQRGERWTAKSGFTIEPDKTPNAAGARLIFGDAAVDGGLAAVTADATAGKRRRLLVLNGIPRAAWPESLEDAVAAAEFSVVSDLLESSLTNRAKVVLPGCSVFEKDGTFMNFQRRVQRIRRALQPPDGVRPEADWLQEILVARGERERVLSAEGVFRQMVAAVPSLEGMTYASVGELGAAAK